MPVLPRNFDAARLRALIAGDDANERSAHTAWYLVTGVWFRVLATGDWFHVEWLHHSTFPRRPLLCCGPRCGQFTFPLNGPNAGDFATQFSQVARCVEFFRRRLKPQAEQFLFRFVYREHELFVVHLADFGCGAHGGSGCLVSGEWCLVR
jgi:hypothetical protein